METTPILSFNSSYKSKKCSQAFECLILDQRCLLNKHKNFIEDHQIRSYIFLIEVYKSSNKIFNSSWKSPNHHKSLWKSYRNLQIFRKIFLKFSNLQYKDLILRSPQIFFNVKACSLKREVPIYMIGELPLILSLNILDIIIFIVIIIFLLIITFKLIIISVLFFNYQN